MAQDNILRTKELLDEVNVVLGNNIKMLNNAAKAYDNMSSSAKLPSDFINSLNQYNKAGKETQKTENETKQAITSKIPTLRQLAAEYRKTKKEQEKLNKESEKETKAIKSKIPTLTQLANQRKREQRELEKTAGLYNRVQRGINSLTRQYNDLAIRKELNGKLSAEEELQLGKLEAKLGKYQAALKNVDARIGKHQRNVGNYKSSFDGLGFSVAQLSREMPAFANSMQTGFMAISNNIPMLVDEINRLKRSNQELAASGKPTTSVLRSLGKALFSWQTLISIGVTLLTVYGAKLFDWAFGMSEAEKATKEATEELDKQNESLKENIRLRQQQIGQTRSQIDQSQLITYLKLLSENPLGFADLAEGEAVLAEISDRLEKIGANNAKVLKDQNILQSDRVTIAANLLKIEELRNKLDAERLRLNETLAEQQAILDDKSISAQTRRAKLMRLGSTSLDETLRLQKEIVYFEEANQRLIGKTVQLEQDRTKEKEKQKDSQYVDPSSILAIQNTISELDSLASRVDRTSKAYETLTSQSKMLKTWLDALTGSLKEVKKDVGEVAYEFPDLEDNMNDAIKTIEKLREETDKFITSIRNGFLGEAGFGSLSQFFDFDKDGKSTFDKLFEGADTLKDKFAVTFTAISNIAKDAFAFINQFSQENFQAEFERLEQRKNIAIQFAGESTAARENIERQYDQKRREIERRQARAQKETAIFNAVINTAQAVVSALATVAFPANIGVAALMGALGAAQIALISSQSIPQYWQGGIVGEQKIMVNDDPMGKKGSNYKEVVEKPNGQLLFPQGKNVKMTVPKGSRVYPTYDNFMQSLNHELGINNIGMSDIQPMVFNNGLTKDQIKDVMNEHGQKVVSAIRNKTEYSVSWDENGIHKYIKKGHSKQKVLNARFTGRGINV